MSSNVRQKVYWRHKSIDLQTMREPGLTAKFYETRTALWFDIQVNGTMRPWIMSLMHANGVCRSSCVTAVSLLIIASRLQGLQTCCRSERPGSLPG